MLLVLACAVFLLFVVPGMLFGLGRMIEANTDGRTRRIAARTDTYRDPRDPEQTSWIRRPMLPAFYRATRVE